ncbi:hypothetical protein THAOC_29671, partial [Thalassiosira oceanica]
DKLLGMSLNSVIRNSRGESYEYQLFHFLSSKEFAGICSANLPTDAMKYIPAGWVFLGIELSDILQEWLVIEAKGVRMKLEPDLFNASRTLQLGPEELKSETNRFGGWAGRSCMARRSKYLGGDAEKCSNDPQYRLLDLMVCYEKDLSEDYVATKVEFALYLSNYAGEGGLSFVAEPFFDALISIMRVVSTAVTLEDFASNNSGDVWAKGKKFVSLSSNLLSDFSLACKRQVDIAREADPTFPDISHAVIVKVYTNVVTKICNARFGAVEDAYKLRASLKGGAHLSFRGMLFASVEGSKKKSDADDVSEKSASPGTITLPVPGDRTAVGKDFLKGKRIVIYGCYEEIAEIAFIAKAELRSCLESFGAKVGTSLTDSTDYFLAGKGTPPTKVKKAQEKNIRIVNLNRMLRLLRGNLKDFDAMHALHPLDKTSFTDKNYERAVNEAADSAEDAGVEPDADDEDDRRRRALAPLPTNAQAGDRGGGCHRGPDPDAATAAAEEEEEEEARGGRKKRGAGQSPATSHPSATARERKLGDEKKDEVVPGGSTARRISGFAGAPKKSLIGIARRILGVGRQLKLLHPSETIPDEAAPRRLVKPPPKKSTSVLPQHVAARDGPTAGSRATDPPSTHLRVKHSDLGTAPYHAPHHGATTRILRLSPRPRISANLGPRSPEIDSRSGETSRSPGPVGVGAETTAHNFVSGCRGGDDNISTVANGSAFLDSRAREECKRWGAKYEPPSDLKSKENRIGVRSCEEFYGPLNEILKRQYTVEGYEGLLLSPRGKYDEDGAYVCRPCRDSLSMEHTVPPKFAIANGFFCGHLPEEIDGLRFEATEGDRGVKKLTGLFLCKPLDKNKDFEVDEDLIAFEKRLHDLQDRIVFSPAWSLGICSWTGNALHS